jgi:hypothetical protein
LGYILGSFFKNSSGHPGRHRDVEPALDEKINENGERFATGVDKVVSQAGLPDFQTKNRTLGKFWRVLQWKMYVHIFYGHLVNFYGHWVYLWTFGIFCSNLVYFSRFGMLFQEKSGNPVYKLLPVPGKMTV